MKRNKILLVLMAIAATAIFSFGVISCGDDDDETTYYTITYSVDSGFGPHRAQFP